MLEFLIKVWTSIIFRSNHRAAWDPLFSQNHVFGLWKTLWKTVVSEGIRRDF